MSTCLQPHAVGTSLKIGLSSHFLSFFLMSSETLPIFTEIFFFLVVPVLFKYNRMGVKYLMTYAAFARCTSVKILYGEETEV